MCEARRHLRETENDHQDRDGGDSRRRAPHHGPVRSVFAGFGIAIGTARAPGSPTARLR
jgi:hypothetical protein